jgi:predicted dehydrogenase
MDSIRFAVIGLGRFGQKRIRSVLANEGLDLVYVSDVDRELTRNVAKQTEASGIEFDELLSRRDFDVALVAVPNRAHFDLVVRLLADRHDVWCEKPMSVDTVRARAMVRTSVLHRRMLKVGSNVRFFPNVMRAEELVRTRLEATPTFVRGWIGNVGEHLSAGGWHTSRQVSGGGTLLDNGVHFIDLMRHLVGEVRTCKFCVTYHRLWPFPGLEDNAFVMYELENRTPASMQSSWTDSAGYLYFEIHYPNGFVQIDCRADNAALTYKIGDNGPISEDFSRVRKRSHDLELERFLSDYRDGVHPEPTSYDGYRAVNVACTSYRSRARGMPLRTFGSEDRKLQALFAKSFTLRDEGLSSPAPVGQAE